MGRHKSHTTYVSKGRTDSQRFKAFQALRDAPKPETTHPPTQDTTPPPKNQRLVIHPPKKPSTRSPKRSGPYLCPVAGCNKNTHPYKNLSGIRYHEQHTHKLVVHEDGSEEIVLPKNEITKVDLVVTPPGRENKRVTRGSTKKTESIEVDLVASPSTGENERLTRDLTKKTKKTKKTKMSTEEQRIAAYRAEAATGFMVYDEVEDSEKKHDDDASVDEDDNIVVHRQGRSNSADSSPLSDVQSLIEQEAASPLPASNPSANRGWARKGKEPARDGRDPGAAIILNTDEPEYEDEPVDEGDIDPHDYSEGELELDPNDDVREPADVIELEDDTDDDDAPVPDHLKKNKKTKKNEMLSEFPMMRRYWRAPGFSAEGHGKIEMMFCEIERMPYHGSWEKTEFLQLEKDKEMLRYLQDVPLPKWIIPQSHAEDAILRLNERTRWRSVGIPVYGPQVVPQATPSSYLNQQPPPPYYGSPYGNVRPNFQQHSGNQPQQPMTYRPSPNGQPMPPSHVLPSQHNMPAGPPPNGMSPTGYPPSHQYPHPQQLMGPPPPPQQPFPQQYGHQQQQFGQPGMQYNGQTIQQMAYPNGQMQPRTYPGMAPQHMMPLGGKDTNSQDGGTSRTNRKKKSPTAQSPGPTPPYAVRDRPAERKKFTKTGKRSARKAAEAELFPWHRQIDFVGLKNIPAAHRWDIGEYDLAILDEMAQVRKRNAPAIIKRDAELVLKQKNSKNKKNGNGGADDTGESEDNLGKGTTLRGLKGNRDTSETVGDPNSSGNFSFADQDSRLKALVYGFKVPEDFLDAAESRTDPVMHVTLREASKEILLCWKPPMKKEKDNKTPLEQAVFRAYDTLNTRAQYDHCALLTKRAAECITDFCPDMLWREVLLRMVAEASFGNTDIRNRLSFNGCYADKATITKRISAALGQKQTNPVRRKDEKTEDGAEPGPSSKGGRRRTAESKDAAGRYMEGESEWNEGNKLDFNNYVRFFGGKSNGGYLRKQRTGGKRKASEVEETEVGETGDGNSKRARTEEETEGSGDVTSPDADGGAEEGEEEEEDDEDAVSVQSDGVLDDIED